MRYKRLVLEGFIPLKLNGVKRFEFTPESNEQIILGANGSAKSTTMGEWGPLPAIKANYEDKGRKEFHCEHNGSEFTCISVLSKAGGKHTFIKDGEVLSDNGTAQVQAELVKQHLGYDTEIHDIMTDAVKFTRMGPSQRHHWITKISGADFRYVMNLWKTLKTDLRDSQGALKNVNKKLSEMVDSDKFDAKNEEARLESDKDDVVAELNSLSTAMPKSPQMFNDVMHVIDDVAERVHKRFEFLGKGVLDRFRSLKRRYPDINFADPDVLMASMQEAKAERERYLFAAKATLDGQKREYGRIANIVEQVEAMGTGGVQSAKDNIVQLEKELTELKSKVNSFDISNPAQAKKETLSVLQPLRHWLTTTPGNPDGYSIGKLNDINAQLEQHHALVVKWGRVLNNVEERIEHIKEAKDETCPKCDYVYTPGVSEGELASLEEKAKKGREMVTSKKEEIKELEETKEAIEEYIGKLRQFKQFRQSNPSMEPLWNALGESGELEKAPSVLLILVNEWLSDLETAFKISDTERRLVDNQQAVEKLEALDIPEGGYGEWTTELQSSIADNVDIVAKETKATEAVKKDEQFVKNALNLMRETQNDLETLCKAHDDVLDVLRADFLKEDIDHHYSWVGRLFDEIKNIRSRTDMISEYEREKTRLEKEIDVVSLLVEEISPKNGLIADVIIRFIKEMTDHMNDVVRSVWTYDLEVIPTGFSEAAGDLDYKFPLRVRGNPRPVKDVSLGSSGQEDIINFAFKVVALNLMGMSDYPLVLDELAPQLDEQHRINITQYVSKMVSSGRCSQLFMISHFQAGHGSFANAQYCVMDPSNITLPTKYNEHIKFD